MFRPGSWCDVCVLPDGRIAFVRVDGTFIVCEIEGAEVWRVDAKVPSLFLRCAALADSTVAAIVKANDPQGSALLILRNTVMNLGPTAGNNPVALTSTHAYIVTASDLAHRVRLDDGFEEAVALPWTSQGIRDVFQDEVITADATFAATDKGYNFGEYQTRGDLTVGQHGYGIGVLIGSTFFVARQGPTNFGVHGAQSGSRIAVCAYTEAGSYYQDFTPPYPAGPVVTPPPPPPPPKGDTMTIPQPIYDTLNAVATKFFDMHASPDDNMRREAMKRGIQTVRARHAGGAGPLDGSRWVCKSEHATGWGAASKDAAGYVDGTQPIVDGAQTTMHIFDTISGTSHRMNPSPLAEVGQPAPSPRPAYALIPEPFDWLADVSPPPPPPPAPNTHLYDGGENDTGTCDICHLSRFDPVHVTAESTVKHAYNGGEQDTGLCDICQKAASDSIHDLSPQQPPGGGGTPGGTVSLDGTALKLLDEILASCHAQETRQAETIGAIQELREAVVGAGKNLTGELIKAAPGFLAVLLPLLKKSSAAARAAKVTRKSRK